MDPGTDLQAAIVTALKAAAVAGGRVYDRVPQGATFPLITIGEVQVIDDDTEGHEAVEAFVTVHTWSQQSAPGGKPETMGLQRAIRVALHDVDLALTSWRLVEIRHRDSRAFLDADGITVHGVCTYRAMLDAP